jgi:chromosome segregation ATPase
MEQNYAGIRVKPYLDLQTFFQMFSEIRMILLNLKWLQRILPSSIKRQLSLLDRQRLKLRLIRRKLTQSKENLKTSEKKTLSSATLINEIISKYNDNNYMGFTNYHLMRNRSVVFKKTRNYGIYSLKDQSNNIFRLKKALNAFHEYSRNFGSLSLYINPDIHESNFTKLSTSTIFEDIDNDLNIYRRATTIENILKLQIDIKFLENNDKNLTTLENYFSCIKQYSIKRQELKTISIKKNILASKLEKLHKKRSDEFVSGLHEITFFLKDIYRSITAGGDAELELIDCFDPLHGGIVFRVRPPEKEWHNISNLSGGEKTIASLSLFFCITLIQTLADVFDR